MAINDQFRFWFDLPGQGITQVFPFNASLKWTDKRKAGYPRLIQRTLETPLILMDEPKENNYGFTYLMDLERQGLTCERVEVTIDRYCHCDDSWTSNWYEGYLRLNAGEWEVSGCKVTIPVVVNDPFACLTNSWTNDVNMYDYGDPPVEITPFVGVIEKLTCTSEVMYHTFPAGTSTTSAIGWVLNYFWNNPQDDCQTSWPGGTFDPKTMIKHTYWGAINFATNPVTGLTSVQIIFQIRTEWAREFVSGGPMPPGPHWVAVTGGWARQINVTAIPPLDHTTTEGMDAIIAEWGDFSGIEIGLVSKWVIVGEDANGNSTFTNGKELGPLIIDLLADCGLTIISNFYNINPDGTNPDNEYYDNAAVDFSQIILYQVSDIARIDETQSATIANIKVKELIDAMLIPNCDISITGTTVRIEHESYWTEEVQMDLTLPEFYHLIADKWKYTYDQEAQPKNEIIAWGVETDGKGGDFDGYPIEYDNACVNDQEDKTDKITQATNYVTNLLKVIGNEDFFDDTETIVMVSTSNLVINSATQPLSGYSKLNGNLALGYLIPRYYDYGRPHKEGYINKILTPFYKSLRLRLQAPITIPMQCDDYMNNFDPVKLIKTQLGACLIDSDTYTDPDGTMELKLRGK